MKTPRTRSALLKHARIASAVLAGVSTTGTTIGQGCPNQGCRIGGGFYCAQNSDRGVSCAVAGNLSSCTTTICPPPDPHSSLLLQSDKQALNVDMDLGRPEFASLFKPCTAVATRPQPNQLSHATTDVDTSFSLFSQDLAGPIKLVSATFGQKDVFESGVLINRSSQSITGFRIAMVIVGKDNKVTVTPSEWIATPSGIPPGSMYPVPGLGISSAVLPKGAKVVSFVAIEAKRHDGTFWHADRNHLKKSVATDTAPTNTSTT